MNAQNLVDTLLGEKVLTTAARKHVRSFALPKKKKYPDQDREHGANALSRVSQHGTPEEKATVRRNVCRKYPTLPSCKTRESLEEGNKLSIRDKKAIEAAADEISESFGLYLEDLFNENVELKDVPGSNDDSEFNYHTDAERYFGQYLLGLSFGPEASEDEKLDEPGSHAGDIVDVDEPGEE